MITEIINVTECKKNIYPLTLLSHPQGAHGKGGQKEGEWKGGLTIFSIQFCLHSEETCQVTLP